MALRPHDMDMRTDPECAAAALDGLADCLLDGGLPEDPDGSLGIAQGVAECLGFALLAGLDVETMPLQVVAWWRARSEAEIVVTLDGVMALCTETHWDDTIEVAVDRALAIFATMAMWGGVADHHPSLLAAEEALDLLIGAEIGGQQPVYP